MALTNYFNYEKLSATTLTTKLPRGYISRKSCVIVMGIDSLAVSFESCDKTQISEVNSIAYI